MIPHITIQMADGISGSIQFKDAIITTIFSPQWEVLYW